jgi:hypothetical protein
MGVAGARHMTWRIRDAENDTHIKRCGCVKENGIALANKSRLWGFLKLKLQYMTLSILA